MQRFKIKHSRVSRKEIVPSRVRVPTFLFRLCNSSPIEPIPFLLLPVRSFRSFAPAFIPHTCNIVRGKKALNAQLMLLDRFAGYLGGYTPMRFRFGYLGLVSRIPATVSARNNTTPGLSPAKMPRITGFLTSFDPRVALFLPSSKVYRGIVRKTSKR